MSIATNLFELIPELGHWDHGDGISPADWIYLKGRADHALGFCALLWPDLLLFEGYVLRAPLDVERLRAWEHAGLNRSEIETATNAFLLENIFPDDPTVPASLKDKQTELFATIMADMLSAKLLREFPDRRFSTFVMDGDDFGVSFHQV